MQATIQKAASRESGWSAVRPATIAAVLLAMVLAGCTTTPEQAALSLVRRLGGKAMPADGQEGIVRIDLAHTAVTDNDLARLAGLGGGGPAGPLGRMEALDLTHTGITDRGVESLAAFPRVRKLSLTLTKVTDAGLASLSTMEHLTELYLIETQLTDAAVEPLSRLRHLQTLVLLRTDVSDAGVDSLRRALPRAKVQIEPAAARSGRKKP
ncbi:MAG: hypothetical protein NTY17_10175 [Planctomycetia bacterium]|nr:hypothetical protein [Planctomycetia bacterium]